MKSAKRRSSPFWDRVTSLVKAVWQVSPFAWGRQPRLRTALCSSLRRVKCSRCFTSSMTSPTGSSVSCWHGTFESRRTWSISYSTQARSGSPARSEEHTSELQSHSDLVCRLLLEKKKKKKIQYDYT